jgi:hypothetical protein
MAGLYRATLEETSTNPGVRLDELRLLLTKLERQKGDHSHKGLQAAQMLNDIEYANQARSDLSSWEAEPTLSAAF